MTQCSKLKLEFHFNLKSIRSVRINTIQSFVINCNIYEVKKKTKRNMHLSCLLALCILIVGLPIGKAIGINELYQYSKANELEHGLDKFRFLKLDTPIHFYSDTYDHIYVSGIVEYGSAVFSILRIICKLKRKKKKRNTTVPNKLGTFHTLLFQKSSAWIIIKCFNKMINRFCFRFSFTSI